MDAHAHLLSLGWAGPGHSLDSQPYKQKGHRGLAYDPAKVGNNGNGLVKPLAISQRKGRFGIGKKAHEPQAGNEWWLKGFESALGNIGKTNSERSSGTSTPTLQSLGKHGGLYNFFIKGQQMQGTIGDVEELGRSSKKRKSDVLDDSTDGLSQDESKKHNSTDDFEQAGAFFALRDKDEKRRQRMEKSSPEKEFQLMNEYLEARSDKKGKKKRKSEAMSSEVSTPLDTDPVVDEIGYVETKEERRERRRRRKAEKEQKRKALADLANQQQVRIDTASDTDDAAAKAARKAERKRRKAEKAMKF